MLAALIALPPVAFAVWLLLDAAELPEGRDSGRERAGVALGTAVLLGPVALSLLGAFGWLLLLVLATLALTGFAGLKRSGRLPRRPRTASLRALVGR